MAVYLYAAASKNTVTIRLPAAIPPSPGNGIVVESSLWHFCPYPSATDFLCHKSEQFLPDYVTLTIALWKLFRKKN
jgi:hypothetical protein